MNTRPRPAAFTSPPWHLFLALLPSVAQAVEWADLGIPADPVQMISFTCGAAPERHCFLPERQIAHGILLQYDQPAVLASFLDNLSPGPTANSSRPLSGQCHARLASGTWQTWPLAEAADASILLLHGDAAFRFPDAFVTLMRTQAPSLLTAAVESAPAAVPTAPTGHFEWPGSQPSRLATPIVPEHVINPPDSPLREFPGVPKGTEGLRERPAFNLADENFSLWVPDDYDDATPHGLYVWVSPGDGKARLFSEWIPVFQEKKIIWIAAHETGNPEAPDRRVRLAQEARRLALRNFNIDSARIFGSGFSGGGRIISWMHASGLKEWTGSIHFAGFDPLAASIPDAEKANFVQYGYEPVPGALQHVRQNVRLFLIQGADDKVNRSTKSVIPWGQEQRLMIDGLIIPGLAHKVPNEPGPIRQALDFVDQQPAASPQPMIAADVIAGIEIVEKMAATDRPAARQAATNAWNRYPELRTFPRFLKLIDALEQW